MGTKSDSSASSATNPVSSGGGGTIFEQHVDALFLALLLVRAPLPVLKDCQVEEVHLQAEHLGWATDDALVVAERPDGVQRRLAAQVKRQFKISENDDVCTKAFGDFWSDFSGDEFDPDLDRLALITLRGTNTLLDAFNSLLDCARASKDADDFMRRLQVDGYLSKKARGYAATIRNILVSAGAAPTDEQFWRFLSVIHVVSFDLNTAAAQNEAWVKALLAATASGGNPMQAAELSWHELLELAGSGMPTASSFAHTDLPDDLRARHGAIDTRSTEVLRALSDHGAVTLDAIKTTISNTVEVARAELVSKVVEALNEHQVVMISAPAGFGKSAVAKLCVGQLDPELHCLAFRAEEFATSHIDQTLGQAQVPANGAELLGILAGQGRKLVLVESVERLLEASAREAFTDLLNLARKDRSLGLLITCRDYSLETVSSALLGQSGLPFEVIDVPPLGDDDLNQVAAASPHLAAALHDEHLKQLLRSPYLLDKAAQMNWSDGEDFPANEREFRRRCWGEVVRRNASASDGMPERRERAFQEVALRRAQMLRPFVPVDDLDAGALDALRNDGLIASPPDRSSMAAPGHDVLEDWAIIQWISRRWDRHEHAAAALAADVGGYPAVRRAYRKWLSETTRVDPAVAAFGLSVVQDETLPAYFRDDTLVCILKSLSAREFLTSHRAVLFEDNGRLLVRVIHLLRVACKSPMSWLRNDAAVPSQMLMATGEAWSAVLELALGGVDELLPVQAPILLGLIEDFASSVSWQQPEPNGFREAAKIGCRLLEHLDGYRMDDMRVRTLKVIAKVPSGDEDAFKALVDRAIADEERDRIADDVSKVLLDDIEGWNACRFLPAEVIRLAKSQYLMSEEDLDPRRDRMRAIDVEPMFGLQEQLRRSSYPASAIRGIFSPLLRHHPRDGVQFIIELFNHAGDWYGQQRWPYERLEPASHVTIEIPGEDQITQWANSRLWGLYRGHEVGPYILQSALMALETWLLQVCDLEGVDVEPWLLRILRESNNVMATAVVASICNAHPEKAGRAGPALLSSRELIGLDRIRMVKERPHLSFSGMLPDFGLNKIYEEERKTSGALSHRGSDLEALAVKLQLNEGRESIHALIDRHRSSLPPTDEQTEEDRLWRLALHRMDVRGFRALEELPPEEAEDSADGDSEEAPQGKRYVVGPGELEPDIQELVDRHAPIAAQQSGKLSLLNWGNAAWEGRESAHPDIQDWETALTRARARNEGPEPEGFMCGGPGLVAAVCARDHWNAMPPEDQAWCIDQLIQEVERDSDTEDMTARVGRGAYRPDRHAAYVLPGLLTQDLSEAQFRRVEEAVAKALTHSVEEVVVYASEGVGVASAGDKSRRFDSYMAVIAWQAGVISQRLAEERQQPYDKQRQPGEIVREVLPAARAAIVAAELDPQVELKGLALDDWPGVEAAKIIMTVVGHSPDSDLAIDFYRRIAGSLLEEWDREFEDRDHHRQRDFEFIHECMRRLARFILKLDGAQALLLCEPLVAAVERHSREVRDFIRDLVVEADQSSGEDAFWPVWDAFADAIRTASWIDRIDSRHARGQELVAAIFLGSYWKENIRHWHRLNDANGRIDALALQLQGSAAAFEAYCRFLHDIGESSFPRAFVVLADSLAAGDAPTMLADKNVTFLLETLLTRHVYSEPHRLKSDPAARQAVLVLLDYLVEAGSSAAYRMRDDFVTPLSQAAAA